ncbi:MAG: hypothetical protein CMG14_03360 [Candidatus Marinimicrobia bacterium]|nr:hypothetical protein [Candidatus Neomarinimicrobiota bacterium]|tara:strand:- start:7982 stop:9262 length:1281 start_codon:yes stop_codon:yes gene_type:complete
MKLLLIILLTFLISAPPFSVVSNTNPYPAKIFIHSVEEDSYMSILDDDLSYYWIINNDNKGVDFKVNNSKLTFYHKPNDILNNPFWIVADHTMTEVDSIQCTRGFTDFHDMIITDNNTYILQSYDSKVMDLSSIGASEFQLVNDILRIQEFDLDHNLIFDWDASEHLNIYDYASTLFSQNLIDGFIWMHGNSIEIDHDNNLILSNRTSSEIIKINRLSGELIWILGGPLNEFQILDDPLNGTYSQHDVTRLENGNLLIFDNRTFAPNLHRNNISRVVEYELDEVNKTARLVWEFKNPYDYTSFSMGSAQRLPNQNTFINWGNCNQPNIAANIMEVDYNKNIVLELQFSNHQSYKATKSEFEFSIPMNVGDINLDNTLNIQDIIAIINYVLSSNESYSIFYLYKADVNRDHLINIIDIIEVVNRALN